MALFNSFLPPVDEAWNAIFNEASIPKDHLLTSDRIARDLQIVWLEKLRQFVLAQNGDLSLLEPFEDFRELVGVRRPEPTHDQWLWLYTQVGARRWNKKMADPVGIMAGRDALLSFLASIPDKRIWDRHAEQNVIDTQLPYQDLEDAIVADAPAQMTIFRMMCRGVSDDDVLKRALQLQKNSIVASMFKALPQTKKVETLITVHTDWEDLTEFSRLLPEYEDEIATWRDPWGNGFFWYLYRRPVLEKKIIQSLPEKIMETFALKNIYGFSPEDLWIYYRPQQERICIS